MVKLFVGNLPYSCDSCELQQLFDKYGRVVSCDIVEGKGFAFVVR